MIRKGRVIGQCDQSTLLSIKHMASLVEKPEDVDTTTITRSQRFAFIFMSMAFRKNIKWDTIKAAVRLVLFWGYAEGDLEYIEIRFMNNKQEANKFKELWYSEAT